MQQTAIDKLTMQALLQRELDSCPANVREAFLPHLIDLTPKSLKWEYGNCEEFQSWVFADMGERDVVATYCLGGFGALGSPWGIVFRRDDYFGQDPGWYQSLEELLVDWGIGKAA